MHSSEPRDTPIEDTAALWLARLDRGLSADEQDAYLEWLRADPRNGEVMLAMQGTWARLDRLALSRPAHGAPVDPDLLTPARRRPKWRVATGLAALAAVLVAVAVVTWSPPREDGPADPRVRVLPGAERLALEDGSLVELAADAVFEAAFGAGERRVRLLRGDAIFSVAHDPQRPFIVDTGGYEVRAVGTAFAVRRAVGQVIVLVTEGVVRLDAAEAGAGEAPVLERLIAGQKATVGPPGEAVAVRTVEPAEIERLLAWRATRLEFDELPLRDVVVAFNRHNARRLVVADAETGEIAVGGVFRADHLDVFVRLLDTGFDVEAEADEQAILLRRRPAGSGR